MSRKSPFALAEHKPVVVGTGLVALDVVMNTDVHQRPRLWAGGTCGNVLTILSYLGWQAYPVARLNENIPAKHLLRDLRKWGVHLKFVHARHGGSTPVIVEHIRHNAAGKALHTFSWSCPRCGAVLPRYKAVLAADARAIAAQIEHPQVCFLDRVSPGTLILARASATQGALVVFEPSSIGDPRLFREALALAHILKYSHERMEPLEAMVSTGGPLLTIKTFGEEGLRYRSKLPLYETNDWEWLNAYAVDDVRDAAGAGDWCTAGIIYRLGQQGLEGLQQVTATQLLDALCFGQALAAWNCGFEGARGGMYSVTKKVFRCDIEQIMTGKSPKRSILEHSNSAEKEVFHAICPRHCQHAEYMVPKTAVCAM
jgi:sugar/nucleoside kinase (ribokinase family)